MRRPLALAMVLALVIVTGACPLLADSMARSASCCHHSKTPRTPCSESTATVCPYVLLEKAKSELGLVGIHFSPDAAVAAVKIDATPGVISHIDLRYQADSSDTYLVLRILRL